MLDYVWYVIPGYCSYEINIETQEVRSNKHFRADSHHIMKVYDDGTVRITDDFGVRRSITPEELYDITFNQGYELKPRAGEDVYCGGMAKVNRNMIGNLNILDGTYYAIEEPKVEYADYPIITTISLIKPFKINPQ